MFVLIVFWCLAGLGGIIAAWRVWWHYGVTEAQPHMAGTLAVIGGVGGVVALVVAYRKQYQAESQDQRQELVQAITLLGGEQASTRIAGIYTLTDFGHSHEEYRQRVISILCGYLRTTRKDDNAVESTIIQQFHTLLSGEHYWKHISLDLHGATINEAFIISGCHIEKGSFSFTVFNDKANFSLSTFNDGADFSHATFNGRVDLDRATFHGYVADFNHTTFNEYAGLSEDVFNGTADFSHATFNGFAVFTGTTFALLADLHDAIFNGDADLSDTIFNGNFILTKAVFNGDADFSGATFSRKTNFTRVTFNGDQVWRFVTKGGQPFEPEP